ncbi:MAG: tRNA (adenosine(37)-N6)-threonylcarbamoyltransferase complex dimerization subunit type 1 TsaB [Synergistaceae bacterium]|nr:tRNA (adenosine(37)-N6)-threonylcarbamoyltransferase complex dimerization subunit type 1 TsaB [Synergistaceae bacterium]
MKLTLAIDCSMGWVSLGLADDGTLYGEENANVGRAQSELLPGLAGGFVARHGFALRDLERIAVTTGPGYYTGIRVGLAYATTLASGMGIPAVPVSSLYAIASPLTGSGFAVASAIRARRGSLYGAIYGLPQDTAPAVLSAAEFIELVRSSGCGRGDIVITGPDLDEFDEISSSGYRVIRTPPAIGLHLARASLELDAVPPATIRATYVRPPD